MDFVSGILTGGFEHLKSTESEKKQQKTFRCNFGRHFNVVEWAELSSRYFAKLIFLDLLIKAWPQVLPRAPDTFG